MYSVNVNKLKAKLVESGMSISDLAVAIGMNKSTLYRKLQDNCRTLLVADAISIANVLKLSSEELTAIFFTKNVA